MVGTVLSALLLTLVSGIIAFCLSLFLWRTRFRIVVILAGLLFAGIVIWDMTVFFISTLWPEKPPLYSLRFQLKDSAFKLMPILGFLLGPLAGLAVGTATAVSRDRARQWAIGWSSAFVLSFATLLFIGVV